MAGFQSKSEGFDSPAARHKLRDPLYINVYADGFGLCWRSREEAMFARDRERTLVYRLRVWPKEKPYMT